MKLIKAPNYKFFESIEDLPIWNWFKVYEKQDYSYLLKDGPRKLIAQEKEHLERVFGKITDEFIDEFGPSEKLTKILTLQSELAVLNFEMVFNLDNSRKTFIKIAQYNLDALLKEDIEKVSNTRLRAQVEKYMGRALPERDVCVKDYYTYVEMLREEAEAREQQLMRTRHG